MNAKERYYANQAKKGKITKAQASSAIAGKGLNVSKPKVYSQKVVDSSFDPENAQLRSGVDSSGNTYGPSYDPSSQYYSPSVVKKAAEEKSKSSSSKPSPKPASTPSNSIMLNRTIAAPVYNDTLSGGTSILGKVKQGVGNFMSGAMGSFGNMLGNNGLARASTNLGLTDQQRQENINKALGIETANASPSRLGEALSQTAVQDQPTGYGPNGEQYYNDFNPAIDGPTRTGSYYDPKNFSQPGSESAYLNQGISPQITASNAQDRKVSYGARPVNVSSEQYSPTQNNSKNTSRSNPTPITPKIFNQPNPTQQLVDLLQSPQQDFTPQQPDNGTVRQFLGNGSLSTGEYANGKGNYGVQGSLTGTQGGDNQYQDILNNIFGIPTANAAEMPQQSMNNPLTQNSWYQNQIPTYSGVATNLNIPSTTSTTPTYKPQTAGNVAHPTSQPISQPINNPVLDYQNQALKGYDAQVKARKQALSQFIKTIKNQYSQSRDQGMSDLNKSKQQDLLKLSGLFSFANQSPDSEQRIQYEQRANNDYANQMTNLEKQLANGQANDISGANQNYQKTLSDIMSQKSTAQMNIAQLLQTAQENAANRANKSSGGSTSAGSQTWVGNNAQGEPVYYNSKTGGYTTQSGLSRQAEDPVVAYLKSQQGGQGGQQGGSWEIDPSTGQQVWVTN